jgi:hypothetical protein
MMNKINTAQGEWTIMQARNNVDFREVRAWASDTFGTPDTVERAWPPRWMYLAGNNFVFLFEQDAVMFALRWA